MNDQRDGGPSGGWRDTERGPGRRRAYYIPIFFPLGERYRLDTPGCKGGNVECFVSFGSLITCFAWELVGRRLPHSFGFFFT